MAADPRLVEAMTAAADVLNAAMAQERAARMAAQDAVKAETQAKERCSAAYKLFVEAAEGFRKSLQS